MHKPRTNTNVLEINQSLIELMAEWRISEKDDQLIFTKIVGLQLKKIRLISNLQGGVFVYRPGPVINKCMLEKDGMVTPTLPRGKTRQGSPC